MNPIRRFSLALLVSAAGAVLLFETGAYAQELPPPATQSPTPTPTPPFTTCSSVNLPVASVSSPIVYLDTSISLFGFYAGYSITNNSGSAIGDLWVQLEDFSGGVITLNGNEDGISHIGALANGATAYAFFYLGVSAATATAQTHKVVLYPSDPALSSSTCKYASSLTSAEALGAANNTLSSLTYSPNPPQLGGIMTMTLTGDTGVLGGAGIFAATPAALAAWRPDIFELQSTQIVMTGGNTRTDNNTLYLSGLNSPTTAYTVNYNFRIKGITAANTTVYPVNYINSGTQIKHTNTSTYGTLAPIVAPENLAYISSLTFSPSSLSGAGTTTVTVTFTNTGGTAIRMDEINVTLPTSPGSPTYSSGTSNFGGSSISNPTQSGSVLTWLGTFDIPSSGTATLTFNISLPATTGTYTLSAIGLVDGTQIDSTTSTTDNSPQTGSISVGATPTPSPTASPTNSPSPTASPTNSPSPSPTPTQSPTGSPTESPTEAPTEAPTEIPTVSPSESPTESPTAAPTESLTPTPTASPTEPPPPSETPTVSPTDSPTESPTASPTEQPTAGPTAAPTESPEPTATPDETPTASPTESPTESPTPTGSPTAEPTMEPPTINSPNDGATTNTQPPINGTGPANTTIEVYIDGVLHGTTQTDGNGNWTFIPPAPLSRGHHTALGYAVVDSNRIPTSTTADFEIRAETPLDFDGDGITDITASHESNGALTFRSSMSIISSLVSTTVKGKIPVPADYDGDSTWDYAAIEKRGRDLIWNIKLSSTGGSTSLKHGSTNDKILTGCRLLTPYKYSAVVIRGSQVMAREIDSGSVEMFTIPQLSKGQLIGCGDVTQDGKDELLFTKVTGRTESTGVIAVSLTGRLREFKQHSRFPRTIVGREASAGTPLVGILTWFSDSKRETKFISLGSNFSSPSVSLPGQNVDVSSGSFMPDTTLETGVYWQDSGTIMRRMLTDSSSSEVVMTSPTNYALTRPQRIYNPAQ